MTEFKVGNKVKLRPEITYFDFAAVCIPKEIYDEVCENGAIVKQAEEGSILFETKNGTLWSCSASCFQRFIPEMPRHLFEM